MALGIEPNSIAPNLIANSGQALVQGIRQIGQQISGHLTEMQVKRDLGGLAQEMQGLNPQSADFPVQLMQLGSRHPMALRDERGQMLLSIPAKAHAQWQAEESDAKAFQRAMQMQGFKEQAAATRAAATDARRGEEIINIGGRGVKRGTGEVVLELPDKPEGPYTLAPGAVRFGPTGQKIAENPRPVGLTPGQSATDARLTRKNKIDLLMRQDAAARTEFGRLERRRDDLSKQRMELKEGNANIPYLDNTVKAIEDEAKAIRQQRLDIQKAIEAIESVPIGEGDAEQGAVEPELGVVPASAASPVQPAGVLPSPEGVPAPASSSELVLVIDPNGRPGKIRASQLEAALQNGYRRR